MLRQTLSLALVVLLGARILPAQQIQAAPERLPLEIVSIDPPLNALNVPRAASISIRFNQPVDLTSFTTRDFHVFGRWSTLRDGALTQVGSTVTFTPDLVFSAGETVFVTLSKSIATPSGVALGRGFAWSFWTESRRSSTDYSLVQTLTAGDTPYGGYGGDIDRDGDLDICAPNENTSDVSVFLNDGAGTFGTHTTFGVGFHCSPSEAADFDFDGNVDLAVANILDDDVSILLGNGDGTFQAQDRYDVGDQPRGLTLLDADGDGDMDVVTANRVSTNLSLLENEGDGTFAPAVSFPGGVGGETGISACDMNNDGIFDLVVVGYSNNRVAVRLGDGNGAFVAKAHEGMIVGANPWMVVTGDVNGDGWNDLATILSGASSAAVALNQGDGTLGAPATYSCGSFPIAIDLGDLNGDGHLDMTASSFSGGSFTLFTNDGSGVFGGATTLPALSTGSCTILHDTDGDGDVDITGIDELADVIYVFRQDG